MADKTAAGAKLFIGGTEITGDPNDETQSSLEGYSYTEIGRIQSLGELGDQFQVANYTELNDGRVKRIATFKDGGELGVTVTFTNSDTGVDAMIAALGKNYGFKIELDDAGSTGGSPASPTTFYFAGMPTANRRQLQDGSNVLTRTLPIQVQSEVFEVDAV
jgi:hypothetical protein